jgi:hypothetical protein
MKVILWSKMTVINGKCTHIDILLLLFLFLMTATPPPPPTTTS